MSDVSINVTENGPLSVKGPFRLIDADGNDFDIDARRRVALCRCGGSTTKPFCDGTHSRIGFEAAERAVRPPTLGSPEARAAPRCLNLVAEAQAMFNDAMIPRRLSRRLVGALLATVIACAVVWAHSAQGIDHMGWTTPWPSASR